MNAPGNSEGPSLHHCSNASFLSDANIVCFLCIRPKPERLNLCSNLSSVFRDVWDTQPPPEDHPWFDMPNGYMTAHTSGTTLDAQERYLEGIHTMLDQYIKGEPFQDDFYIVKDGELNSSYV